MIGILIRFTIVTLLVSGVFALTAPVRADERPTLRAKVSVVSDVVTIADFFENPGPLADEPLFRAPDLGEVGAIEAWRVIDAARLVGLASASAGGNVTISVERRAMPVSAEDITHLIAETLSRRANLTEAEVLDITYTTPPANYEAHPGSAEPVQLIVLNWSRRTGAFSAEIAVDQGSRKQRVHVAGSAQEMVEVAQLARAYARDEIVSKDDVVVERIPRRMANLRFVVTPEKIIGLAARRNLRARVPLTATDFTPPMMVQRGEMVTIVYEAPGLTLTARGKALEAGAENDMINVLNSQSNRIVRARITAHGKVAVTSNRARALKVSEVVQ